MFCNAACGGIEYTFIFYGGFKSRMCSEVVMSKKYNRSYHLPFSLGCSSDDKMMDDVSELLNKEVVISEKMDGGNVCLERHNCYAELILDLQPILLLTYLNRFIHLLNI